LEAAAEGTHRLQARGQTSTASGSTAGWRPEDFKASCNLNRSVTSRL